MRQNKSLIAKKENTKPGSGNYFKNRSKSNARLLDQILITDINESKRSEIVNIRSLDKVKIIYLIIFFIKFFYIELI
jgi:hypothetical protein